MSLTTLKYPVPTVYPTLPPTSRRPIRRRQPTRDPEQPVMMLVVVTDNPSLLDTKTESTPLSISLTRYPTLSLVLSLTSLLSFFSTSLNTFLLFFSYYYILMGSGIRGFWVNVRGFRKVLGRVTTSTRCLFFMEGGIWGLCGPW